ncbi:MAG: hypothetical protein ACYCQK_01140 [Acidiferrobacteraceae bacterium]
MEAADQYVRLAIGDTGFLLPAGASLAIEPVEQLTAETGHPYIVAWRANRSERWPVFRLSPDLCSHSTQPWTKAVFLGARPTPVGFCVADLLLLPRGLRVEPFNPPGPAPTPVGHIFCGASVQDSEVRLVLAPQAFAAYLKQLGGL